MAKKHGVSETTLMKKANAEGWTRQRQQTYSKAGEKAQQKTANAVAENAVILQRCRKKLLLRLEKEIDALPDLIGSGSSLSVVDGTNRKKRTEKRTEWSIRQLAGAYHDLAEEDFKREKLELEKQKAEDDW